MAGINENNNHLNSPQLSSYLCILMINSSKSRLEVKGAVQIMPGNTGDKFDYVCFLASGPTGVVTAGKSYYASQLLGAGSACMTSKTRCNKSLWCRMSRYRFVEKEYAGSRI